MSKDFLELQARLKPDVLAVVDLVASRSWTYQAWNTIINRTISWLQSRGLKPGDRVACLAKNCPEIVALHLACGRAGFIFVPLNWRLSQAELLYLVEDCTPSLILGDDEASRHEISCLGIAGLFDKVAAFEAAVVCDEYYAQPTLILYSSGTTGQPKGIVHSEASIMETTLNMALLAQVDDNSTYLCETPMFHVIGLISCVRPALYCGGKIIISDGFEPARTLNRLQDITLGITHYFCVPQMASLLRQHEDFNPRELKTLKAILTGGAPHPAAQIETWLDAGIAIVDGYGMSEAGTVFGMPFGRDIIRKKAGCVGVPTHRIQVRLADPQNPTLISPNIGEVQLKGDNLFLGIWRQAERYAGCFTPDGWFRTGDVAVFDDEGFYRIVDRIKDMFISGGENVYPVEIESVVLAYPGILECALVGVPDEKWGEVGKLFLVPGNDGMEFSKSALLAFLEKSLARYKLPKHIEIVDKLPRNGAGKVQKNLLRSLTV